MANKPLIHVMIEEPPIDALLLARMKRALGAITGLNLREYRTPSGFGLYTAMDILKQSLEVLFEFGPSTKSYREANRVIKTYSPSQSALICISAGFSLFANTILTVYSVTRKIESLLPRLIFQEGIPVDIEEWQRIFRSVGIKYPTVTLAAVSRLIYLDEDFEPYEAALRENRKLSFYPGERLEHWYRKVIDNFNIHDEGAILKAGGFFIERPTNLLGWMKTLSMQRERGKLVRMLTKKGIKINVAFRSTSLEKVYGAKRRFLL